ncbi:phosphoribosylformylglycinamidine synthase [Caloramator quimbayensis]|uniref:Phosphoribosylformylglycinamidine synthase n=1 Tax=Caloramator quimbayensis TaxID=1147123 RepID=A0A1T4WW23_9CLOT|nr:phosphoribosylformylglycinamidine synthase [Caloramator quimbayensis]SKA81504.1 phosphoribosylformylglycinamidine synthase [Caloramator quimbayensis]
MNSNIKRLFVEKKPDFNVETIRLLEEIREGLGINSIKGVRILNRYDVANLSEEEFERAKKNVLSEPAVDYAYEEEFKLNESDRVFAVEYLPGQYDQRADSAAQCIQILTGKERPLVHAAKVIILNGDISDEEFERIKKYCINTVDSREASLTKPDKIDYDFEKPKDVDVLEGFIDFTEDELLKFYKEKEFAMSFEDLKFCREYFKNEEHRNPTITEIRVIDTYWSDHCRHTTFLTKIKDIKFEDSQYKDILEKAYHEYILSREYVYENNKKDICLMDIATIAMKELRKRGLLNDLDISDEINACSIEVDANVKGENEKYLIMFKNETHNHPTEIEPFGGAATCLGGAIRDPLSGRAYVYQAMRITGSGDPRTKIEDTLPQKLPQIKITREAARGYSSYGNQIGLATGFVDEVYDEGFVAKRMEIGAVIGAAPKKNVLRERPAFGDVVILVGGRTGRDGCGGATGSSKEHDEESIIKCGAEVQKGNAVEERKLQRLFKNPKVSTMIKRCNDFGAGGVSVAIGELSEGLDINLDAVPKKYEGLDGTELAISESQERMAVVVSKDDAEKFIEYAREENLEATVVAYITEDRRLKMKWREKYIVDISRDFLDTNGVKQNTDVFVSKPLKENSFFEREFYSDKNLKERWLLNLEDLSVCSKRGLVEMFDSTIGSSTVLMPYGGKYQLTLTEGMAAKIPFADTTTCTLMTYGYEPKLAKWSPFHGGVYAIVEAVAKIVAMGGDYSRVRLTLQEYFERLRNEPKRWGKPFSALLGAFYTQKMLKIPAIGGKDSMSGSFKDLDVPPTLVAFAVDVCDAKDVISPEFKKAGSRVLKVELDRDEFDMPRFDMLIKNYSKITELIKEGKILSAHTIRYGGVSEAVSKMCFGNKIGFVFSKEADIDKLFTPDIGSLVLEIDDDCDLEKEFKDIEYSIIGLTMAEQFIRIKDVYISLDECIKSYERPLEKVFHTKTKNYERVLFTPLSKVNNKKHSVLNFAKPEVFIPVFPGTNCEYDSAAAFERAGAKVNISVFRNLTSRDIENSVDEMVKNIKNSQIIMIPGGFSAGDEPDGSGKFIATVFRNPKIKYEVMNFIKNRYGLILGICNGFQALIKLGLLPYGEIRDMEDDSPTLTYNEIGRHMSRIAMTKIISNKSPWFNNVNVGDVYAIPISHGEGRFAANKQIIEKLFENGQVATQYVDFEGNPTYDISFNPNGSAFAIEGITSPDGRILGKMAHSERIGLYTLKNIPFEKDQRIFEAGVEYFK